VEKVYENSLAFALRRAQIPFAQQKYIEVCYEGVKVGKYLADLVVEDRGD
jgi:GxxExxY protein